jgi:hypothetical protein
MARLIWVKLSPSPAPPEEKIEEYQEYLTEAKKILKEYDQ